MDCIFCDIVSGNREKQVLYQDDIHLAFLDKYPIDTGHALVIPKKHYERITMMDHHDVGELFSLTTTIASAILKVTGASAFSLAQNNGRDAKQIVPHVHVHIIPRYAKKGAIWTKREIGDDDTLHALAKTIKSQLDA